MSGAAIHSREGKAGVVKHGDRMWMSEIRHTLRLHEPLLLHSTEGWASLAAVATATQAADFGQVRSEQSCSVQAGSPLDRT